MQKKMPTITTPLLQSIAKLWLMRCEGSRLPARSDFTDDDLRPYFGHMLIVDTADVPHKFRFRLLGTSLADAASRELTGKYFEDADITGYEPDVLDDYHQVAQRRVPICKIRTFQPRDGAFADDWRTYERLLLPLASDGQNIDRILGCSYPLGEPAQESNSQ